MDQPPVTIVHEGADQGGEPRSVEHEYTLNWAPILSHLGASLLVTTLFLEALGSGDTIPNSGPVVDARPGMEGPRQCDTGLADCS